MKTIDITYLDHSGFAVVMPGAILVFDYYRDPSRALSALLMNHPDLPVTFFVSHSHHDHFNPAIFSLAETRQRTFILSDDIKGSTMMPDGNFVSWVSPGSILPDLPGGITVTAFGSTDRGVSFLIESQSHLTLFHAGDLNDWHWQDDSTPTEVKSADDAFDKILSDLSSTITHINVAMLPVDPRIGSGYARGARQFLHTITTDYFIPMHFQGDPYAGCDATQLSPDNSTRIEYMPTPGQTATFDFA